METDTHRTSPILPPELEFIILRIALKENTIDAINLLFVAKRAYDWSAFPPLSLRVLRNSS